MDSVRVRAARVTNVPYSPHRAHGQAQHPGQLPDPGGPAGADALLPAPGLRGVQDRADSRR
ncbi:hypothetical protein [Nonomuraea angiospora]|uniref:hypothetical protein n=1 Tax=Nonomuraea angiospora TaxID=46172 RepID=UPI00299F9919|nr:hypothetical protein [Nonomuraea angiospora]MDX3099379.1 hypothetical protein [Nonomuraea angiospora]